MKVDIKICGLRDWKEILPSQTKQNIPSLIIDRGRMELSRDDKHIL